MSSLRLVPLLLAGGLALGCSTAAAQDRPFHGEPKEAAEREHERERELAEVERALREHLAEMHEHQRMIDALQQKRAAFEHHREAELRTRALRRTEEAESRIAELEHELIDMRSREAKTDQHPKVKAVLQQIEAEKDRLATFEAHLAEEAQKHTEDAAQMADRIDRHRSEMAQLEERIAMLRKQVRPGERVHLPRPDRFGAPNVERRVAELERAVHSLHELLQRHGIDGDRHERAMREMERRRRREPAHSGEWPHRIERREARDPRERVRPSVGEWVRETRPPEGGALRAQITELSDALARARAENDELRQRMEHAHASVKQAHAQRETLEANLRDVMTKTDQIASERARDAHKVETHVLELQRENSALKSEIADLRELVEKLSRERDGDGPR